MTPKPQSEQHLVRFRDARRIFLRREGILLENLRSNLSHDELRIVARSIRDNREDFKKVLDSSPNQ